MGAAITAALVAPGWRAVGVFAGLGVGLALPLVALTWLPGLGRLLPRPGAWMERLRQALAFPLYLTVAWLAWVLAQQAGADGVLVVAVGCAVLGFCGWLLGLARDGGRGGRAVRAVALVLAAGVFASVLTIRPGAPTATEADAFSVRRLDALRAEGRPVFVDMTAAWCVSCLVNERLALRPEAVRAAFARRGVVLLRGDWTRRDPAITAFLRAHGSDGVPLYVFYPAAGGAPVVLPQILTPGIVLRAVST
jgi:thiol:disulfide interchange protein DsbD